MGRSSDTAGAGAGGRVARGRLGESLAAAYLELSGHRVVERNRRVGTLELDLVTLEGPDLVVVEVRLRSGREHGWAEESIDRRKRARLVSAGRRLWEERGEGTRGLRFDLVAISLLPHGLGLRHYRHFLDPAGPGVGDGR